VILIVEDVDAFAILVWAGDETKAKRESKMSATSVPSFSVPFMHLRLATNSEVTLGVSGLRVEVGPLALDVGSIDLLHPIRDLTSSIATEIDSSPYCRMSITSLVIASARRVFCCSDFPGHNFTMT
jgi:hypothetical protein